MSFCYIFVHGLSGWGSYDKAYRLLPYWGMRGGDLMTFLRKHGFESYAASVAPKGSAWDRACELYAQLTGKRTDYGLAHSREKKHGRFGRDFSGCPLIPAWDPDVRLVLIGHSFGGATVRLLSELLAHGDSREREATAPADLSPLFAGGSERQLHSIVTLASPMNGTTAYDLYEDASFDPTGVKTPRWSGIMNWMLSRRTSRTGDGRDPSDFADYDMHVDHALEMNARLSTLPGVYYYSVPCSTTERQPDGSVQPRRGMEPHLAVTSRHIGAYTGRTKGCVVIDESWRENDGLVNTVSAMAPIGAPSKPLNKTQIEPGVWNVFPTLPADHLWLQGGLLHKHDIRSFYLEMLNMISSV